MIFPALALAVLLLCLLEPGFTFFLHRLEEQIPFGASVSLLVPVVYGCRSDDDRRFRDLDRTDGLPERFGFPEPQIPIQE